MDGCAIVQVHATLKPFCFLLSACGELALGLGEALGRVAGDLRRRHERRMPDLRRKKGLPVAQRVRLAASQEDGAKQEGRQPTRPGTPRDARPIASPAPFHDLTRGTVPCHILLQVYHGNTDYLTKQSVDVRLVGVSDYSHYPCSSGDRLP